MRYPRLSQGRFAKAIHPVEVVRKSGTGVEQEVERPRIVIIRSDTNTAIAPHAGGRVDLCRQQTQSATI